jgi:hypothetical protein
MPNPALKKFRDYLSAGAAGTRTIKADDLDWNFKRSTVMDSQVAGSPIYKAQYNSEGTELSFTANGKAVKWVEIDICVAGAAKKMMVLGTDPY